MNAIPSKALPQHLAVVLTLAHVLQKMEGSTQVSAEQYRSVVQHLSEALSTVPSDAALHAVLDAHPAAAELYENLQYEHAGLCRSPLEWSMRAEQRAKDTIERARAA
jgi:hemoglobin-like flavoprotein